MQIERRLVVRAITAIGCATLITWPARAVVLTSTGFEAPDYATGALAGQNAWTLFTTGATSGDFGTVTDNAANAHAGSQYLRVNTADWAAPGNADSTVSIDNSAGFLANVGALPIVHARVTIRQNTQTGNRINQGLLDLRSGGPSGTSLAYIGLHSGSSDPTGGFVTVHAQSGQAIFIHGSSFLNSYRTFDVYLNYSTGLVSFAMNGISLDGAIASSERGFNTSLPFGGAGLHSRFGFGTGGTEIRYDDYLVEMVPAPGGAALAGLALPFTRRRRRS